MRTGVSYPRYCGKVVERSEAVWCAYCHRRMCKGCGTKCEGDDNDHKETHYEIGYKNGNRERCFCLRCVHDERMPQWEWSQCCLQCPAKHY